VSDLSCFKSEAILKRQRGVAEAMKTSFREPRRPTFSILQSCCHLSRGSLSGRNQYLWLPPIRGARRWSEHDACLRHDQCVCDTALLPVLAFHTQIHVPLVPFFSCVGVRSGAACAAPGVRGRPHHVWHCSRWLRRQHPHAVCAGPRTLSWRWTFP